MSNGAESDATLECYLCQPSIINGDLDRLWREFRFYTIHYALYSTDRVVSTCSIIFFIFDQEKQMQVINNT